LRSVNLFGAALDHTRLVKADLRGAELKGMIDFTDADLTDADLRSADLKGVVNFENAILDGANFSGSEIEFDLLILKKCFYEKYYWFRERKS